MSFTVIVHLANEEPIEGEIEELPTGTASFIAVKNPRKRGNRDLEWLDHRSGMLLVSFSQLTCVEVIPQRSQHELVTKYATDMR